MEEKAETKYLDIWKVLEKIKCLFLFSPNTQFWPYSPQNTTATVNYILRRDDAILKGKIVLQILTALKNWLRKYCHRGKNLHIQEQKMCNIYDYLSNTLCLYYALYSGVQSTKKVSIIYIE